jgi:hypothetical protein
MSLSAGRTAPIVRLLAVLRICCFASLLLSSCSNEPTTNAPNPTAVTGRVVHVEDASRGVPDVLVQIVGASLSTRTDANGWFYLEVSVSDGATVQLAMTKDGFEQVLRSLSVSAGRTNTLEDLVELTRSASNGGSTSGPAQSIAFKSTSATSIGVRHAGGNESALLRFEVRDAQGRPVDLAHRATVQFTLSQVAGGGAALSADTASTDALGQVVVAVSSGTLAQVVQVRARVVSTDIYSDLLRIAIHGGLPDPDHLSFAVEKRNVPGLVTFGITDRVTAYVGDRYGNPVAPGTMVYFATTGGIIQGSAATDDHGRASVDLITALPLPNQSPEFSDSASVARISVQTLGENQVPLIRSGRAILFSGHTELGVLPGGFDLPVGGQQEFTVTVQDREHANPLAGGSTVTVVATRGTLYGETRFVIPDTHDHDFTSFSFGLVNATEGPLLIAPNGVALPLKPLDAARARPLADMVSAHRRPPGIAPAARASIKVSVTSPNGDASVTLFGNLN